MELGVGTIFKTTTGKEVIFNSAIHKVFDDKNGNIKIVHIYFESIYYLNFTILGKPITLADVLRWLIHLNPDDLFYITRRRMLLDLWDLTIPNLSDQPQPVKDFLSNLIPK